MINTTFESNSAIQDMSADEITDVSGGSVRDYLEGIAVGIAIALLFV